MNKQQKPDAAVGQLVEVWGDTVSFQQLIKAIVIGVVVSLAVFFAAKYFIEGMAQDQALAHAYAMLAGLGGCLLAGFISAKLFPPKRLVLESSGEDSEWLQGVLAELAAEGKDLGDLNDLSPEVIQELKELQLYDAFATRQKNPNTTQQH